MINTLWFSGLAMLILGAAGAFAVLALTGGGDNAMSPVTLVGIVFAAIGVYSLLRGPRELAANRMFIVVALAAGAALTAQAGAIRATLLRLQIEYTGPAFGFDLTNVAGEYKDTQITSGWFLALFGAFVILVSSIGMWAKRRDYILSQQRARKQREAAEKSAAEIQAAIDQFKAQKAAAAASPAGSSSDAGGQEG